MSLRTFIQDFHGTYGVPSSSFSQDFHGIYGAGRRQSQEFIAVYASALTAVALYELYIGIGSPPDPDAVAPSATSLTLPFDSLTMSGTGPETFYLLTQKRNAYGLVSRNLLAVSLELDASDQELGQKPDAPVEVTIDPAASGTMDIDANYYYDPNADPDLSATKWLIYLSSDGSDPLLGSPVVTDMVKAKGIARLRYTTGAYADALTIKTVIRSRRIDAGPVNVDSDNTAISSAISDTDGPSQPSATSHFISRGKYGS